MNSQGLDSGVMYGVSAKKGTGIPPLLEEIARRLTVGQDLIQLELPLGSGELLAWLRRSGIMLEETYTDTCVQVAARVSTKVAGQLHKRLESEG